MVIRHFPPISDADEDGLLAAGGDLEPASLLLAYSSGIFPWPLSDGLLAWFAPPERCIIRADGFHVSRSLARTRKRGTYETKVDSDFRGTIEACAAARNRKGQSGTWITREMVEAYCELHRLGYAHSVEAYLDGRLAGGIYGVSLGGFFAGESMFYTATDASKIALWALLRILSASSIHWIDTQVPNEFTQSMGSELVSRHDYMLMLETALQMPAPPWEDFRGFAPVA